MDITVWCHNAIIDEFTLCDSDCEVFLESTRDAKCPVDAKQFRYTVGGNDLQPLLVALVLVRCVSGQIRGVGTAGFAVNGDSGGPVSEVFGAVRTIQHREEFKTAVRECRSANRWCEGRSGGRRGRGEIVHVRFKPTGYRAVGLAVADHDTPAVRTAKKVLAHAPKVSAVCPTSTPGALRTCKALLRGGLIKPGRRHPAVEIVVRERVAVGIPTDRRKEPTSAVVVSLIGAGHFHTKVNHFTHLGGLLDSLREGLGRAKVPVDAEQLIYSIRGDNLQPVRVCYSRIRCARGQEVVVLAVCGTSLRDRLRAIVQIH